MKFRIGFVFFLTCFATLLHAASSEPTEREAMISIAQSYLDALVTHDASKVQLADHVQRFENGVNSGVNADAIRNGLQNDVGFKAIKGLRDIRWVVDGQQVITFYLIDNIIPYTKIPAGTTHVTERFQIENGKITEIEAIFCTSPGIHPEDSKMFPKHHKSILCSRSLV